MLTKLTLGEKLKDLRLAKGYKSTEQLERFWKVDTVILFQQNENGSHVNEREKRGRQLIISGGSSSKVFKFLEKSFNEMTFLVQPPVTAPRDTHMSRPRHKDFELIMRIYFGVSIGYKIPL